MSIVKGKTRRDIDPPIVEHEGTRIVLPAIPTNMGLDKAIEWLQAMKAEDETVITVSETIDAYPWDGARAMAMAIQKRFGFAKAKSDFFTPAQSISVQTDVNKTESIPWGQFEIPGIDGKIATVYGTNDKGQLLFRIAASVRKKHAPIVVELANLTREILRTESIYRGKAVRFDVSEKGDVTVPTFVDLSRVNPEELVYTTDIAEQIDTTVFAPLRRLPWCAELNIPFKRGVCLIGKYGVGKTLAVYVAAQHAKANGITSVVVGDAKRLPQALLFARQYSPALVIVEDIDRVTKERNDLCNDIMDALDGVEAKESDVMVLFTSNHADHIHEAMRRPGRIDTFIRIDAPDAPAVEKLLRLYGRGLIPSDENLSESCHMLAGQIPAVIREVVERAKLAAVARATDISQARTLTSSDLAIASRRLIMQQKLFTAPAPADTTRDVVSAFGKVMMSSVVDDMGKDIKAVKDWAIG